MEEIATRLLQCDPDTTNVCDGMGKTILHLACEQNHIGILKQYIDNTNFEAIVHKPDQLGRTILHYSCIFSKDVQSVKLILDSKVFLKFNLIDELGNYCKAGTNNLKKNVHAEEPNSLDYLLSKVKVTDTGIFPASLRPVENIAEHIDATWEACNTPLKDMQTL